MPRIQAEYQFTAVILSSLFNIYGFRGALA
jgi:hypothetical protein